VLANHSWFFAGDTDRSDVNAPFFMVVAMLSRKPETESGGAIVRRRVYAASAVFLLLVMSDVLAGGASVRPVVGQQATQRAPSVVQIPIRLPLDRLFQMAEVQMPLQAGNWRDWHSVYGIKTKYRAWRGPLHFDMRGDTLLVQAHVRYWIKARKDVLGALKLRSSCGVEEPPRQAIIGVLIRLSWRPDWTLRPEFRVVPTRFLDRCEMTIADVDVTPLVGKEFREQLEDRMRAALAALEPRLRATREQAKRSWSLLQQPVEVGVGRWLLLNPQAVALSPLVAHGGSVDAHLAVLMLPTLFAGSEPVAASRPLPPLMRFYPPWTGLNLQLIVNLDYAGLNRALNELLSSEPIEIQGYRVGAEAVELGGEGQKLRLNARLTGDAVGDLRLSASVVFIEEDQAFQLQDLDYTFLPDNPALEPLAQLFQGHIRKTLEAAANRDLKQRMADWTQQLRKVLTRILPGDVRLDLGSLRLSQAQLSLGNRGLRLRGLASGGILVEAR
jgi:hypothetical protein